MSGRLLELAFGEAHVAVRAGKRPDHPDNVVTPYFHMRSALYAHADYIARHGRPERPEEFAGHRFISHEHAQRNAIFRWLESHVPAENIVLRSSNLGVLGEAVRAGVGIGFMPQFRAAQLPDLVQLFAPQPDWQVPLWLVTHVDLHRTANVQAFLGSLRETADEAKLDPA